MKAIRSDLYFTIETTTHFRPPRREWRVIKCSRKDVTYGFHRSMGLVFANEDECQKEIEARIEGLNEYVSHMPKRGRPFEKTSW